MTLFQGKPSYHINSNGCSNSISGIGSSIESLIKFDLSYLSTELNQTQNTRSSKQQQKELKPTRIESVYYNLKSYSNNKNLFPVAC